MEKNFIHENPCYFATATLHEQRLINLFPDKVWHMRLYWHHFFIQTEIYRHFNQIVLEHARQPLRQKL